MTALLCLFLLLGCSRKQKNISQESVSSERSSFRTKYHRTARKEQDPELRYRALEGLFEVSDASQKSALFQLGLQDASRFVREEIVALGWKNNELNLVQSALQEERLEDGERCLIALRIASMSGEKSIGAWPIISQANLDDQFFCALAASTLLDIKTPWQELLEQGDFPYSLLVVDSLVLFATTAELDLFEDALAWADEGIRASLWASWVLVDPERLSALKDQMSAFSEEECLDMVDLTERHSSAAGFSPLLRFLQKQKGFCGRMADIVAIAQGSKGIVKIEDILENGSREEIVTLLFAMDEYSYSSSQQRRSMRSRLEDFLVYDQEPLILLAAVELLGDLGDRGTQRKMEDLLVRNVDRPILLALEKSYNQIEQRRE